MEEVNLHSSGNLLFFEIPSKSKENKNYFMVCNAGEWARPEIPTLGSTQKKGGQ
jgi:hypothetical protein